MPLNARYIAVTVAVMCFFCLSFVSWFSGLSPFTCCKRAVIGALVAYVAASLVVKAINAILISAMITSQRGHGSAVAPSQQKEKGGGSTRTYTDTNTD